ncbi:hypothetical protein CGJ08_01515 [Vibrio parahaemolyticus]|uniref:hypothetical protein n=1 Tax=Vibrio parahaemolyticus TaxID=670 RepID=UPI0011240DD2|nr:hypothetical protein [Vibrio parahaemolyticus]TOG14246.1 hypothetical protein CGJ08_01515 [Vibrio parahaemolyticus]
MSELKNHYGENVAWFCADVSISLDETNEDGMLDSSVEVYGEDEQGREGSTEIEVIKLLESAHVVIEEQQAKIKELKESDKHSFFSGLAVALQSVSMFDHATMAEEIINGLGSEKEAFYSYLKSEGGVDFETLAYLKSNGL